MEIPGSYYTTLTVKSHIGLVNNYASTCTTTYGCISGDSNFVSQYWHATKAPESIGTMAIELSKNIYCDDIGVVVAEFKTSAGHVVV